MTSYFSTYNDLLKHNLNKLYIHFNHIGLTPEMYLVDWIYSVYAKSMNLELASIVWDNFLRDNDQFLFRAALGKLPCAIFSKIVFCSKIILISYKFFYAQPRNFTQ